MIPEPRLIELRKEQLGHYIIEEQADGTACVFWNNTDGDPVRHFRNYDRAVKKLWEEGNR